MVRAMSARRTASARRAVEDWLRQTIESARDPAILAPVEGTGRQPALGGESFHGGPVDALLACWMVVRRHQAALGIMAEAQNMAELGHHHPAKVTPADTLHIHAHQPADLGSG